MTRQFTPQSGIIYQPNPKAKASIAPQNAEDARALVTEKFIHLLEDTKTKVKIRKTVHLLDSDHLKDWQGRTSAVDEFLRSLADKTRYETKNLTAQEMLTRVHYNLLNSYELTGDEKNPEISEILLVLASVAKQLQGKPVFDESQDTTQVISARYGIGSLDALINIRKTLGDFAESFIDSPTKHGFMSLHDALSSPELQNEDSPAQRSVNLFANMREISWLLESLP